MLRAFAGYLLGGILNDSPIETMECETREVNDWLVVNMSNKLEDTDIDFISERDSEVDDQEALEERDIDFNSKAGSEIDEDEILSCLPMLLTYDELDYEESFLDVKMPINETSLVIVQSANHNQSMRVEDTRFPLQGKFSSKPNENARPAPKINKPYSKPANPFMDNCAWRKVIQATNQLSAMPPVQRPYSGQNPFIRKITPVTRKSYLALDENDTNAHLLEKYLEVDYIKSIWPKDLRFPKKLNLDNSVYPKQIIAMAFAWPRNISDRHFLELVGENQRARKMMVPPFVNHRHASEVIEKEDLKKHLQEQIKELRPAQQAKALTFKKQNSRSQLKRHNQNYIYCSSAKASRRKDLQRNHSGANNNRKC